MMSDIFTSDHKNKLLLDFSKNLKCRQMIVCSDQGNLHNVSYIHDEYQSNLAAYKPFGLWYSYGAAWLKQLSDDYTLPLKIDETKCHASWELKRLDSYTHIYQIYLKRNKIYNLIESEWNAFDKRYATKKKDRIYWERLENDGWSGINIRFNEKRSNFSKYWYEFWDVSGGCIWNKNAIKKTKLLKAFGSVWYDLR